MLDVRKLAALREIAARGSFSAAARRLNYSQSAISQQVVNSSARSAPCSSSAGDAG